MKKTNRFHVKVKKLKLHGFYKENEENEKDKAVAIEIKWKGPQKHGLLPIPFHGNSSVQRNRTAQRVLKEGERVEWDDEFESICEFSAGDASVGFWDTKFYVLLGDSTKSKTKLAVLGKVSLNLAELISNWETQIDINLPITLKDAAVPCQATLSVCVNIVEVRNCPDPTGIVRNPSQHDKDGLLRVLKHLTSFRKKNREKGSPNDGVTSSDWDKYGVYDPEGCPVTAASHDAGENAAVSGSFPILGNQPERKRDQKHGKLPWKNRRLSFRHSKGKVEPWIEKTCPVFNDAVTVDRQEDDSDSSRFPVASISACSQAGAETAEISLEKDGQYKEGSGGSWETREIVSRDGKAKLKTEVFFGSFDQRSEEAGGESACTAIVAVITHWLHSNQGSMPTRPELDSLIMKGSSEWQKLCSNECYSNSFPNKHFDLETVVEADVRPISVLPEKSFVGFFSPEKFDCLTEAMSFEQIWTEINRETEANWEPRIYVVSWNDHFFVLKMAEDACYIVDSLGERLVEGCNQAYMLRFNSSSLMFENAEKGEVGELVCRGKDCCREFFERFLAAITIEELADEQKRLTACSFTPHRRLQIDFHFSCLVASSSTTSTSSLFSDEDCSLFSSPSV